MTSFQRIMSLKKLKTGEKVANNHLLTQVKHKSIVIPAKMVKELERIEKKERIKLK